MRLARASMSYLLASLTITSFTLGLPPSALTFSYKRIIEERNVAGVARATGGG
jgi:hypothetical protein